MIICTVLEKNGVYKGGDMMFEDNSISKVKCLQQVV